MTNKEYDDSISQIDDIIKRTRQETKNLMESLIRLKRFYVWEQRLYNGEIKISKRKDGKWKKNKNITKDVCFDCGSTTNIHYHHVVPQSLGGKETLPICGDCHGKIHDRKFTDTSNLIKQVLKKKKEQGMILGRPKGLVSSEEILKNPKYEEAIRLIKTREFSYRDISSMTGISVNTIMKLNKMVSSGGQS